MAQKPEDKELKKLNLQNLRKQEDKSIHKILGTASHTTLYRFDIAECQWERVGVEGTTFVVLADREPFTRLIVLNKLGDIYKRLLLPCPCGTNDPFLLALSSCILHQRREHFYAGSCPGKQCGLFNYVHLLPCVLSTVAIADICASVASVQVNKVKDETPYLMLRLKANVRGAFSQHCFVF